MSPLVTISIPAYKTEFFEVALKSAIGQSYSNLEIIVSDDSSGSGIEEVCGKYRNVKYRRRTSKEIMNQLDILYIGNGQLIKPLFDDDVLHPFCVERMVNSLWNADKASFCFSSSAVIDVANRVTNRRRPFQQSGIISGENVRTGLVKSMRNFIGEFSTIMVKRDVLDLFAKDSLFCHWGEDFSLGLADVACYLNLAFENNVIYIDEELSYFRKDSDLDSNSNHTVNKNFIYCITHWIDFLMLAKKNNFISHIDAEEALPKVKLLVNSWIKTYPELRKHLGLYESYINDKNLT